MKPPVYWHELLDEERVERAITRFFRRGRVAQMIGISMVQVMDGEEVPEGWVYDPEVEFYLPPNVVIF